MVADLEANLETWSETKKRIVHTIE